MSWECKDAFMAINHQCSRDSRFNAGSVNVDALPSLFSNGAAIDAKGIRYVMAPQQLTR